MACLIGLIDPTKNRFVETYTVDGNYLYAENKAKELNEKLNKKPNPKEMYWSVTHINV
jgi:hypothetical protein